MNDPYPVCGGIYKITVEGIRIMEIPNGRGGCKLIAGCISCKDNKVEKSIKKNHR